MNITAQARTSGMAEPFNKIEAGLGRARVRLREWQQVLDHAKVGSEQWVKAREQMAYYVLESAAQSKLLAYCRKRMRLYSFFAGVDLPADLKEDQTAWTARVIDGGKNG
jgi:hypothetical protein